MCLHLGTTTIIKLEPLEIKGVIPPVYFHFPSVDHQVLHTRAEELGRTIPEDNRPLPPPELVTPINKGKIHNYVIHPHISSRLSMMPVRKAKGKEEFEHIMDNTGIVHQSTDLVKEGVNAIIQGREKNNKLNIRVNFMLCTTHNNKTLFHSIRELNCYCQMQHHTAGPLHRCTLELARGPKVSAWPEEGAFQRL